LTLFTKTLLEQYVGRTVELSCQGGSDEEAWADIAHVKNVRPLEADYCDTDHMFHDVHSTRDTMDKLSLTHMTDYLKLAISFAVEMAEPVSS
jgi:bacterial leucyl aminopeptidase